VPTAGLYTVYIRQIGVNSSPCIFSSKGYSSGQSTFSVTTNATQPRCFGDKATILDCGK
jgi:hypothetical protein